jgi:hypothetical protein
MGHLQVFLDNEDDTTIYFRDFLFLMKNKVKNIDKAYFYTYLLLFILPVLEFFCIKIKNLRSPQIQKALGPRISS